MQTHLQNPRGKESQTNKLRGWLVGWLDDPQYSLLGECDRNPSEVSPSVISAYSESLPGIGSGCREHRPKEDGGTSGCKLIAQLLRWKERSPREIKKR
jgi:hypothetical protein